ncbi:MAG: alpha-amylase family glycosyl hydrolase [Gemmatimonadaceae bacterium]
MRRALAHLLLAAGPALAQTAPADTTAPRPPAAWTRGATCYEVFVRSFQDSNGDGIGDLNGLTSRLDYINDGDSLVARDLGARCIWLMPVAESPSYHGYDATNYYKVEPDYGTNDDFRRMVAEAHRRGIRVLVDMVLNHASSDHPYFRAALSDTASPYRSWFRFSPTKPDEKGPWGQEVWHKSPLRDEWYYGIFWSGMPDLNYETPAVREEARKVARFWLDSMGVDGFRLDAVPYLVEEGTRLAGTPGTHEVLREYGQYVHSVRPDAFTVGEVWDSVGAMLPYYPNELDSYFAFEVADRIVEAVRSGSARGLLAPTLRLQREVPHQRWSPFVRNHDQTRTRTELGGDMRRARLAAILLLTQPGIPFVYYGEEIGMTGDKPDERLRTPMQWGPDSLGGFTTGRAWEAAQPDSQSVTVWAQTRDGSSLLSLYQQLIHLRAVYPELGSGTLVPVAASEGAVAAYLRRSGDNAVLVVVNLGGEALEGVSLAAPRGSLRPGNYGVGSLLGGPAGRPLRVAADGSVGGYIVLRALAPMEGYVFELVPAGR